MHVYKDILWYSVSGCGFMAVSEAQQKANQKYRNKFVYLQARTTDEYRNIVYSHVEKTGESLNTFILRAIAETMERDQSKKE